MKKKLIMAAAIAFAVFAIPCGSNALSLVAAATSNNTVVDNSAEVINKTAAAVSAIDASAIKDETSANDAANALRSIGSDNLVLAMNASDKTLDDIKDIEAAFKKTFGYKDVEFSNKSNAVEAVGMVGAGFYGSATLSVEAPAATPAITEYAVASTPVYVELNFKNGDNEIHELSIPVAITIKVPAGVDGNKATIFHFVNGKVEAIEPKYNSSANTLTFAVNHFSTFAIAETNKKAANGDEEGPSISAFESYREDLCRQIADAKDGTTFKITRDKNINALPNDIMQALYKKQTVALQLEYVFEGKEYTVTIPAGKAENNEIQWYGPLYLQMRYGK